MSYWKSLAFALPTFGLLSCAASPKPEPVKAPSKAPTSPAPTAPQVRESEASRPSVELLAVDERGKLRLVDDQGKTKQILADDLRGARLICSGESRAAIVASPTIARRYELSPSGSKQIRIPPIDLCSGSAGCQVLRFTADSGVEAACLELSDGPLSTATGSSIVSLNFADEPRAEVGQCLVESAPEPSAVSAGGRYSVRAEEGKCGDVCYETIVVVDEKEGRVVKSIAGVVASTRMVWAPRGTGLLIGGTLHDAAVPALSLELGLDACWLVE